LPYGEHCRVTTDKTAAKERGTDRIGRREKWPKNKSEGGRNRAERKRARREGNTGSKENLTDLDDGGKN